MQFKIDLKIFVFLILFYFTKQVEIYVVIILFAIIHEFGHLLAGILLGMQPSSIKLMPYGLSIEFKLIPNDYNKKIVKGNLLVIKKILIALAGPFTNFIIFITLLQINIDMPLKLICLYSNLVLIFFNLLPIHPLDGGRILEGILHIFFGKQKAEKYTNNMSFVFLLIITFIASWAIYYTKNIAIFIIVIFLWILYIKQDIVYKKKNKIYKLIEKTIEIEKNK